ncbi:MAG: Type 1 glutamine amidotransferase-like domain-containing protein [bacterium]|nr:Type 1 glutamine amidotransferase-like domain-containing protein [bacterium]
MKLMLTSAGITNTSLALALQKLVQRKIKIAFIPTAANVQSGEKDWLIKNYNECEKLGSVDIVDISALKKSIWLPRLKKATVLVMGGGNTPYLMDCIKYSGLQEELPRLLKTRIYVGISAGSIVTGKNLVASSTFLYSDEKKNIPKGLGYVPFYVRSHLNSPDFPQMRDMYLKKASKKLDSDLYALDDASALIYIDGKIKIVSEGTWKKY